MKLNNYGFGMRDMIIYSCILLFILIFVAIEINAFYSDLENRDSNNNNKQYVSETNKKDKEKDEDKEIPEEVDYEYYEELEDDLYDAAENYLRENPFDLSEDIQTIKTDTLINLRYLSSFVDQEGNNTCSGYVNAYGNDEDLVIKPYISCYNYRTEGY